ncbi:hypothetical protein [Venatoribacter cucullus]|uniref:hypothetical protein n=1 Tax=Venatoribacter cucullus TaxID=2661630 RepID=UPI00223F1DDD|nr:hypothetical protein [Venatoribacter cucullus]UZK03709.1 hypothetical protein GAY96_07275 [Venatoribacter cucullus]
MAELSTGSETSQFAVSLRLVKNELANALDQAATQLDAYAEQGNAEYLRAFLEEVQQIRGTFKMLDFRAGERLCEELAETGRVVRNQEVTESSLGAFTQAIVFLKRYVDFAVNGEAVAPSLLIPTINLVRRERREKPLPEAYFFLVNLRPKLAAPQATGSLQNFPFRRARQLYQLGLIGLIRGNGRRGPLQVMLRAVRRFEQASRGGASWSFWNVVAGALEALSQDNFDMTPQRLSLLGALDRQVRRIQDTEGRSFSEKIPDWLLKEFLYLVALAEPETPHLQALHSLYHIGQEVREKQLALTRGRLSGPDQSALNSLAEALQEELQSVKDLIDLFERTDISEQNFDELLVSLNRIADTLQIANLADAAARTRSLEQRLQQSGAQGLQRELTYTADEIIHIEQAMRALTQHGLDRAALVDPVSLNEARIAVLSESMTALTMIKRAVGSYLDSNNDKLHIRNVGKSLIDVAGAMMFLEKEPVYQMLLQLEQFIRKQVLDTDIQPPAGRMEAFADAISAIEYYLDSLNGQSAGAEEAVQLAADSIRQLRG